MQSILACSNALSGTLPEGPYAHLPGVSHGRFGKKQSVTAPFVFYALSEVCGATRMQVQMSTNLHAGQQGADQGAALHIHGTYNI